MLSATAHITCPSAGGRPHLSTVAAPHRRFRDANPEEIEALTLEGMRAAVMAQLHAGNLEVSVVGDLDPEELEVRCPAIC
jgi:predicted Zn-dependent peptidase